MIGITGVTGKLGSKVAQLISEQGISARHLARNPQRAALYDNAELVQAAFENSLEAVEALKGIDVLLMVSASKPVEIDTKPLIWSHKVKIYPPCAKP